MRYARICNWEQFQHYKDRNPPWIKLHKTMITSRTWVTLDDASRVLAIACMLIAADTDNKIPLDAAYVKRVAYLNKLPDFAPLVKTDFIEIIGEDDKTPANDSALLATASTMQANRTTEAEAEQSRAEQPPRFALFWRAYPKRRSKDAALKAFAKINPDEQLLAVMLTAIGRAKTRDDWRKESGKYIPYPATWLNAGGWKDEDTAIAPAERRAVV